MRRDPDSVVSRRPAAAGDEPASATWLYGSGTTPTHRHTHCLSYAFSKNRDQQDFSGNTLVEGLLEVIVKFPVTQESGLRKTERDDYPLCAGCGFQRGEPAQQTYSLEVLLGIY